jgi:hypothetical protein
MASGRIAQPDGIWDLQLIDSGRNADRRFG